MITRIGCSKDAQPRVSTIKPKNQTGQPMAEQNDQFYYPFDGYETDEYRYKLKTTSRKNVKQVCKTQAHRFALDPQNRAAYAMQAGMQPSEYKSIPVDAEGKEIPQKKVESGEAPAAKYKKVPLYVLDDIYNEDVVIAKMAEDIFMGFPKLIEAKEVEDGEWDVEVINQELFDALREDVVNGAFLDFRTLRNGTRNRQSRSYVS